MVARRRAGDSGQPAPGKAAGGRVGGAEGGQARGRPADCAAAVRGCAAVRRGGRVRRRGRGRPRAAMARSSGRAAGAAPMTCRGCGRPRRRRGSPWRPPTRPPGRLRRARALRAPSAGRAPAGAATAGSAGSAWCAAPVLLAGGGAAAERMSTGTGRCSVVAVAAGTLVEEEAASARSSHRLCPFVETVGKFTCKRRVENK